MYMSWNPETFLLTFQKVCRLDPKSLYYDVSPSFRSLPLRAHLQPYSDSIVFSDWRHDTVVRHIHHLVAGLTNYTCIADIPLAADTKMKMST
jgi:hypothetical protein